MTEIGISSSDLFVEITLMTNASEIITDRRDVTRVLIKESTKPSPAPVHKRLILSNEEGLRLENPDWTTVETVICQIDCGRGNSFCILENPQRGFVQALHGFNGYHLEWHEGKPDNPDNFQHLRGAYPGGSTKNFELKKSDRLSQGEYRDLLPVEEVIEAFLAFYRSTRKPAWLTWRSIEF